MTVVVLWLQHDHHSHPAVYMAPAKVQPYKNRSDKLAIFGDDGASPADHYASVTRTTFVPRGHVERAAPAPGFDRGTANKTNYSLGMPESMTVPAAASSECLRCCRLVPALPSLPRPSRSSRIVTSPMHRGSTTHHSS